MGVHLWSGRLYIYAGNKECKRTKWKSKNRVYLFSSFCKYIKSLNYAELEEYIKTFYFSVLRKVGTELSLGNFLEEYKKLLTKNYLDSSDYKIHRAYVFYCNCRNSNMLNFSKRKGHLKKQDYRKNKNKRKRVIKNWETSLQGRDKKGNMYWLRTSNKWEVFCNKPWTKI